MSENRTRVLIALILSILIIQMVISTNQINVKGESSGLIAYWNFDESDGNIVYDSINNNDGIVHGSSIVEGIIGNALEFDGIDDYVIINDSDELDFDNTSFTISFWCYPKENERQMRFLSKTYTGFNDEGSWGIRSHNDDLTITFDNLDGGTYPGYSLSNLQIYQWSMVTMTYDHDNDVFKIYINGILDYQTSKNFNLKNTDRDLYIGSRLGTGFFYEGIIDEIKIYHENLSSFEIKTEYNLIADQEIDDNEYIYEVKVFEEGWNSYFIDRDKWNFVDNVLLKNLGKKAFIFNKKLYINAYNDWTHSCGIISKEGFPLDTKVTLDFQIQEIRVYNEYQSILKFLDSGEIHNSGWPLGNKYIELMAGNDNNRILFIRDLDGAQYQLGNYIPEKIYSMEITFSQYKTSVSVNGYDIEIQKSFPNYYIHFGGHVQKTIFDNLKILGKYDEDDPSSIPDLYLNNQDIVFSNNNPFVGETITIYGSIHNNGLLDATSVINFYEGSNFIGSDYVVIQAGESTIASVDHEIDEYRSHEFILTINDSYPPEQNTNNNRASNSLIVNNTGFGENSQLVVSIGKWSQVEILENSYKKVPVSIICYNGSVSNVYVKVLNQENLSITPITPFINLIDLEEVNYYLNISANSLPENTSSFTDLIYLQAIGDGGISSDIEYMQITVHQGIIDSPGFLIPTMIAASGIGALVAIFVALTETGKYKLFSLLIPFVPLFTRVKKSESLDNFVRGRIFGYIESNPGTNYTEIMNKIGVGNGTLSHHLNMLEKMEMIKSRREGIRYRVFYPTKIKFPKDEKYRFSNLQLEIIDLIKNKNGITQKEITEKIGKKQQTINYNIKMMERNGIIKIVKKGRNGHCYYSDE